MARIWGSTGQGRRAPSSLDAVRHHVCHQTSEGPGPLIQNLADPDLSGKARGGAEGIFPKSPHGQ